MKTCAIIPIKSFSKAKTRLDLSIDDTEVLCKVLLEEVLETISKSSYIEKILLVSKDEKAFNIGKKFGCIEIFDEAESGVNNAVTLADSWIKTNHFTSSVIFPQDIPFMTIQDIEYLFNFCRFENSVILVPSRHFDGTNALIRTPSDIMDTRYDEGSYRPQFDSAMIKTSNYSLALIQRIMLDIDSQNDVNFAIQKNMKPIICKKLKEIFY